MKKIFLTAEWRKLAIANYSVDPDILTPYLPYKTELDYWKDKCYVSLVGFMFRNIRLRGIRIPFHTNFPEINPWSKLITQSKATSRLKEWARF